MPNNLPAIPDHFGGRNSELYQLIKAILADGRLITVTGPFGRGKSALAVYVIVSKLLSTLIPNTDTKHSLQH